jgi:acetoin utilization deacetylase AcuC-like enzyme
MRATAPVLVAAHEDCLEHRPFPGHPERPERLAAALEGAAAAGAARLEVDVDEDRVIAAVERVHDPALPRRLRDACRHAPAVFDSQDNPISAGSYRAAVAAAACSLAAVDAVLRGETSTVFVPARPPGHHALHDRAMGFCFFNNVAVAAEEMLARSGGPVAIVDFDVHHGNGTQAHFWERADVFYLSVHRYPFYPGGGSADETGGGRGRGFTRNFPLAGGADDSVYTGALAAGIEEILATMVPRAWLVSAGFDAHREDPLGGMLLSDEGYAAIGSMLAQVRGKGPLIAVLEGGYMLEALRGSVQAFIAGLAETAAS